MQKHRIGVDSPSMGNGDLDQVLLCLSRAELEEGIQLECDTFKAPISFMGSDLYHLGELQASQLEARLQI